MKTNLIHKDKAGNKLYLEDTRLAFRNVQGRLINPEETKALLKEKIVRKKLEKLFKTEKLKFKYI